MNACISKTAAINSMLILLTLVLIFHIAVVLQFIPYEIVWAGKLESTEDMYRFEVISILINVLLLFTLLLKGGFLKLNIPETYLNRVLWLFVLLFSLNTIGNLFAKTLFEKLVFTPLTLVSALLIWIVVKKEKQK